MVARYKIDTEGYLQECSSGDFVDYADYEALEETLEEAIMKVKWIEDKITDIYREM